MSREIIVDETATQEKTPAPHAEGTEAYKCRKEPTPPIIREPGQIVNGTKKFLSMTLALGAGRFSTKWRNTKMGLGELITRLEFPRVAPITLVSYKGLSADEKIRYKDGEGFVGGSLIEDGPRRADTVVDRCIITLDHDGGDLEALDKIKRGIGEYEYVVHTTFSHTPEHPKLRVLVFLAKPIPVKDYALYAEAFATRIDGLEFDVTAYRGNQFMYWPAHPSDGTYTLWHNEGKLYDPVGAEAAEAREGADKVLTGLGSRAKAAAERRPLENPLEKEGLVGDFCRAYELREAMDRWLGEFYGSCGDDRYTYIPGSTSGGAIVYDALWLYSHHSSDPGFGQNLNAFDLVRVHLFGEMDEKVVARAEKKGKVLTPSQYPSYQEMKKLFDQAQVEDKASAAEVEGDESLDKESLAKIWSKLERNERGGEPKSNATNVLLILKEHPYLKDTLKYNLFSKRLEMSGDKIPWKREGDPLHITDATMSEVRNFLNDRYKISNQNVVMDALVSTARKSIYHPVRDYLNSLVWDGIERVDTLLVRHLRAVDDEYVRAVTRKTLVGAVARVFNPGVKFDTCLILSGKQGCGKSEIVKRLALSFAPENGESENWFSDSLKDFSDKDAMQHLGGVWIIELAEMVATSKGDSNVVKNFLSTTTDRYRSSYGRFTEEHPRQCIFIGTTNQGEVLIDETGGRRFWPVEVQHIDPGNKEHPLFPYNLKRDYIDQVWAEAVQRFRDGEPLFLSGSVEITAADKQRNITVRSDSMGEIELWLNQLVPEGWIHMNKGERQRFNRDDLRAEDGAKPRQRVCVREIMEECFNVSPGLSKQHESRSVAAIMAQMPGWEARPLLSCGPYGKQRCYIRVGEE